MTRARVRVGVVLTIGVIALSAATSASAQEAPQLERAWLAGQSRAPATPTESKPSLRWAGPVGLLVLLGAAGGYFYVKRRKRHLVGIPSSIQVLGSARIGPKVHAVVTTVGGKVLVLGVTDHHVSNLATLDDLRELERIAASGSGSGSGSGDAVGHAASVAAADASGLAATERPSREGAFAETEYPESIHTSVMIPGAPQKFRDMLREVLSRAEPSVAPTAAIAPMEQESPAERIALGAVDSFERGHPLEEEPVRQRVGARLAEPPPPLEGQVAGLQRWRAGGPRSSKARSRGS